MPAWSFATIRPKLDRFFESVRASLEARAASGVDRRRLEEFLNQAQILKERLYACLEGDDRSDLPAILKEIQVLAYRTRVLFGSPLPGVAWDDVQHLLVGMPQAPAPGMHVLDGKSTASFASGDLVGREPLAFSTRSLAHDASPRRPEALSPAAELPLPLAAAHADSPTPEPESRSAPEPRPAGLPEGLGLSFGVPRLTEVLVFLLGAIAGYALGGTHPPLTALAVGIAAVLATRAEPAPLRYNEEST